MKIVKTPKKTAVKRGPKPRPADDIRHYRLQIRLSLWERRLLEGKAGDVSTWARETLLREAAK